MRVIPPNMGKYLRENWQYILFASAVVSLFFLVLRVKHLHELRTRPDEIIIAESSWLVKRGKYQEAKEKLMDFARKRSKSPYLKNAYYMLADCLLGIAPVSARPQEMLAGASAYIDRALELGYDRDRILSKRREIARTFLNYGNGRRAFEELSTAMVELPDISRELLLDQSECLLSPSFRDPKKALDVVEEFIGDATEAQRNRGYLQKARVLVALDRIPEAKQILEVLYDESDDPGIRSEAAYQGGLLRFSDAEYASAITWFNEAMQISPEPRIAQMCAYWIAESHRLMDSIERAWEGFVELSLRADLLPEIRFAVYTRIGNILHARGSHARAAENYIKALEGQNYRNVFLNQLVTFDEFRAHVDSLIPHAADLNFLEMIARVYEVVEKIPGRPVMVLFMAGETCRALAEHASLTLLPQSLPDVDESTVADLSLRAARYFTRFARDQGVVDAQVRMSALHGAGITLYHGGDYLGASRMLREFIEFSPASPLKGEARLILGKALMRIFEHREAVDWFVQNIKENPLAITSHESRFLIALCHLEMGNIEFAEQELKAFTELRHITPENYLWRDAMLLLGKVSLRASVQSAVEKLKEAYRRELDQPKPREEFIKACTFMLANCYVAMDDWEKALEYAKISITTRIPGSYPFSAEMRRYVDMDAVARNAHFLMGDCYYALGRFADAIEAYEEARRQYPGEVDHFFATVKIGICYRRLNMLADARAYYLEARAELRELRSEDFGQLPHEYGKDFWSKVIDVVEE